MQHTNWRADLRDAKVTPASLLKEIGLPETALPLAVSGLESFPLRVTRTLRERIETGNSHDPVLRQIFPHADEDIPQSGFSPDPLDERATQPVPGLLHKYQGRVLLVVTGACAVHCRYCFRRHFPYNEANPAPDQWQQALEYIRADLTITEVILSGGDPLTLPDDRLGRLARALDAIPHLKRLRIHTRIPVVLPERITDELLEWLTASRLSPVVVVHVNHANELGEAARTAISRLRLSGIPLLNQSVLLRGVNDSVESLLHLSERLFECGVIPYYLHMLDPVAGATHFHVDEPHAQYIVNELHKKLPGYLVPRLVREVPGASGKISVELCSDPD